jgi:hypothetical protein
MGDTIKTKLEGILRGGLDWKHLAHVRDIWQSVANFVFHKIRRIFLPYKEILASYKGHCFIQLVIQLVLFVCLFFLFVLTSKIICC